jgi:D-cysteine desulfhydrase
MLQVAQEHGILVDPIYSLAAWEAAAQALQIQQSRNSRVVMLHTGGALGLQGVAQRHPDWF